MNNKLQVPGTVVSNLVTPWNLYLPRKSDSEGQNNGKVQIPGTISIKYCNHNQVVLARKERKRNKNLRKALMLPFPGYEFYDLSCTTIT